MAGIFYQWESVLENRGPCTCAALTANIVRCPTPKPNPKPNPNPKPEPEPELKPKLVGS